MSQDSKDKIPNPSEFFTSLALYHAVDYGFEADEAVLRVVAFNGTLDLYCGECGRDTVFISETADSLRRAVPYAAGPTGKSRPHINGGIKTTTFRCSLNKHHEIYFLFLVEKDHVMGILRLTKIGQYPSLADLTSGQLKKYRNILSPSDFTEFNRSIGLAAHGIGIGSFVYLRRIFERLIEEAHQAATTDASWDENVYMKSRMEEKIKILSPFLPPFLSQNWQIYSILSKGIHELSEQECAKYFDVVKGGIELILDQKIEEKERKEKAAALQSSIQKIHTSMK